MAVALRDAVLRKPRVHRAHTVGVRRDELLHLLLRQVQAVTLMARVADFVQLALELGEVVLGERDAQGDDVVRRGRP